MADQFRLYDIFMVSAILAEGVCTTCLIVRRAYRILPMLTFYLAFMSIADTLGGWVYLTGTTRTYWPIFLGVSGAEYCFQIAVMCELIFLLLEPLQLSLSGRWFVLGILGCTACCVTAAALSAGVAMYQLASSDVRAFLNVDLGFSIFRALVLLSLFYLTVLLGLRSNARVGYLAACFSLYSVITLLAQFAREHQLPNAERFEGLECVRIGTWCLLMISVGLYALGHVIPKRQVGLGARTRAKRITMTGEWRSSTELEKRND